MPRRRASAGSGRPSVRWLVERHERVGSTMDVAAELASRGAPAGTVILAEEQTAGRGRAGRVWLAPPGTCLLFTVLLRPDLRVAQNPSLSRVIAERVAAAVQEVTGVASVVKEPNDLMVGGKKLAGILCQTSIRGDRLEYLLIGIGLNVNLEPDRLPFPTATSLLAETGVAWDRDRLLDAILRHLALERELVEPAPGASVV